MNKWLLTCLYLVLGVAYTFAQTSLNDSLKVVILESPDDTIKVQNLITLSQNLAGTDNPNAIYYASRARNLAETLGYESGVALALKYIGMGYYKQSDYAQAVNYWEQSLDVFRKIGDRAGEANILSNLGALNSDQGDETRGAEYYLEALAIAEEVGDTMRIGTVLFNIGFAYSKKESTYQRALDYYARALPLFEQLDYQDGIGAATGNIADIFFLEENYDSAELYLEKSLAAVEGTEYVAYTMNYLGRVFARKGQFSEAIAYQEEALGLARQYGLKYDEAKVYLGLAETYQLQGLHQQAVSYYNEAIPFLNKSADFKIEMQEAYQGLAKSYGEVEDFGNAFRYQKLLTAIKDTLYNVANQKKLDLLVSNFENSQKQIAIDLLTKEKALQDLNLQKERLIKNAFLSGFVVILIIAFMIFRNYRNKVKTNKLLDKQKEEIEGLLLNILPAEVATELQQKGHATPRNYDSATVLFADFKGFTNISADLQPHQLIAELSSYFNEFDNIIEQHNLEKIKTIGDSYMCAGGLPMSNTTHAFDAVRAGLAMQKHIASKNAERRADGLVPWELRVGIHTGPVVAGVVGQKKYAYDIWGDAVNIASRMETNGESGKVNISETTRDLVESEFKCVPRGMISVKGAGQRNMYFVEEKDVE